MRGRGEAGGQRRGTRPGPRLLSRTGTLTRHEQDRPLQPLVLCGPCAYGSTHNSATALTCSGKVATANPVDLHAITCAVCRPPAGVARQEIGITPQAGGGCTVTVSTYFVNGTYSSSCPGGSCNCAVPAPIYGMQCGTLYASVYLYLDLAVTLSGPSLATYLNNVGIGNVNTVYGVVHFQLGSTQPVNWPIDVWTNLEVIRPDPEGAVISGPPWSSLLHALSLTSCPLVRQLYAQGLPSSVQILHAPLLSHRCKTYANWQRSIFRGSKCLFTDIKIPYGVAVSCPMFLSVLVQSHVKPSCLQQGLEKCSSMQIAGL